MTFFQLTAAGVVGFSRQRLFSERVSSTFPALGGENDSDSASFSCEHVSDRRT
jgi:hypothetical protein